MKDCKSDFLKLYEPVHESFSRFCHAKSYGVLEAEDLISESVLAALEGFDKLKNKEAFLSFLFSIASNIVAKKIRRKKFFGAFNPVQVLKIESSEMAADKRLDIEILYSMLNKLPNNQKEALLLFEISGFSIKEVAQIQKASPDAVKQRLKRGRTKLAELLNEPKLANESVAKRSVVLTSIFF